MAHLHHHHHNVADNIANTPYDKGLAESLRALSQMVSVEQGSGKGQFPRSGAGLFRSDQDDVLYFQARTRRARWSSATGNSVGRQRRAMSSRAKCSFVMA